MAVTKLSRLAYLLTGLTFLLPAVSTLGSAIADAAEILPHKAFYILHSRPVPGGAESVNADGLLIFEWIDTCDGWQVNQRAKIRLSGEEADTGFEWRQITWESKD
ncbi:MAG: DUF1849 family protein, partial [Dongiaceae bacterium]